jgi:hypothetical protein
MAWGDAFKSAWNKATDAARNVAGALATGAKKVKGWAKEKASDVADWAKEKYAVAKKKATETADWVKKKTDEVTEWAKKKATQVADWGKEKYAEAKQWTKETATKAWEATKKGVSKLTSPMANWVKDKYRKIKNIFGNQVAGNPVTSCSKGQLTQPNPLSTGDKVTAALAALGTTAQAAISGYNDGGLIGAALSALEQLGSLEEKLPNAEKKSLLEKIIIKEVVNLPKLVKQIPALYKMGLSYNKVTGLINIGKGNLLNVHPGRYKLWTPLKTMQPFATKTGRKMLGKAGAIGALMEMGGEVFKYATDPTKSFASLEFANDISKAGVKGFAKGMAGTIVTGKSTALFAAIGTMICPGIGTVIGGGVGFIAGVAASVAADELIDKAIDWTWEKAGQAAKAIGEGAKYVGEKAKQAAKVVGETAKAVWNGAKNVAQWATSWW